MLYLKNYVHCFLQKKGEKDINLYRKVIKNNLPDFIKESIYIPRYGISVEPWDN
jgi:hypothetical protein